MNKGTKIGIGGVILLSIGGLAFVAAKKNTVKAVEVRMEKVEARDLVASVTASGQIQPRTLVNVSADVSGKIVRLAVKEGDVVRKGQFLLQIDPEQVTAALQRAEAQLASTQAQSAQAKANLMQAQRNYERSTAIQKQNAQLVSEEQVEQLKTTFEVNKQLAEAASFGVAQARASVRDARQALNKTTIVAPMSGKITRLVVEEGETAIQGNLNRDAATLLTIADMGVLETKVKVDETDVARISVGDSAVIQIDAFPDTTFVGRVVEISNSSVSRTATGGATGDQAIDYEVRVQLLNPPPETRPDFSATAKIVTDLRVKAIAIPIIALTVRENEKLGSDTAVAVGGAQPPKEMGKRDVEGVFVVGKDNKVTFRPVKVGIAGERHFEVLDGLKLGDNIVAGTYQAIRELKDGALVKAPKPEEKKPVATEKKS